jgi:hypothetical protein
MRSDAPAMEAVEAGPLSEGEQELPVGQFGLRKNLRH